MRDGTAAASPTKTASCLDNEGEMWRRAAFERLELRHKETDTDKLQRESAG